MPGVDLVREISTHALLAEGDSWGTRRPAPPRRISTHALLAEGDVSRMIATFFSALFQPTPSLRRATATRRLRGSTSLNFNPRPPCGGRPQPANNYAAGDTFQPTPSLRRATYATLQRPEAVLTFQPTPSLRRATQIEDMMGDANEFQPTPSLRRATANLNNSTNCYLFKFARFVCSSRHMLSLKFQRYP